MSSVFVRPGMPLTGPVPTLGQPLVGPGLDAATGGPIATPGTTQTTWISPVPAGCGLLSHAPHAAMAAGTSPIGEMGASGGGATGGTRRGPRLVRHEELPPIFRMHPLLATALNEKYPKTTARLYRILERLLSHQRFGKYDEDFVFLLTDNIDAAAGIYMFTNAATLFPHNVVVLSNGLLHKLISREGIVSDDHVAFILSHELIHLALRREGYDMGDPLRPNHHIEDQADIQALRLMDESGYSVRFAGFTQFLDDIGRNFRMGLFHPDTWWRHVKMDELIDAGHFSGYSELATAFFSDDEIAEAMSPTYKTRLYKGAAALFGRMGLESYVDGVESVENGEEALVHVANLFMRYAMEEVKEDRREGLFAFGEALKKLRRHSEEGGYIPYFDVDNTAVMPTPFLDDLADSQIQIMNQFAADDAIFRFHDLPTGEKERHGRKLAILKTYLGSLAFAEYVRRLKWIYTHGRQRGKEDSKASETFERELVRLMRKITSINPRLRPLAIFLEKSFLDVHSLKDLRFGYDEAKDFLELFPVREHVFARREVEAKMFGNMPRLHGETALDVPHALASAAAGHALFEMLGRTRPKQNQALSIDGEQGDPDASDIFDNAFSDLRAEPSNLRGLLVMRAAAEDPMRGHLFRDYHLKTEVPEGVRINIRSRYDTAQITHSVIDAISRDDVPDVIFWMGCLGEGERDEIIFDHFDFFEGRTKPAFRKDLLRLMSRRRDVKLPPEVKSEAAARLYRLLEFFSSGNADSYWRSGELAKIIHTADEYFLSNFSLLWKIDDDEELGYIAQLFIEKFDDILKTMHSLYPFNKAMSFRLPGRNVPLALYVALRLISEGKKEEFRTLAKAREDDHAEDDYPFVRNADRHVPDFIFDYMEFDGAYILHSDDDDAPPEYGFERFDDRRIESALKRLYSMMSGRRWGISSLVMTLQRIYLSRALETPDSDLDQFIVWDDRHLDVLLHSVVGYDERFHPVEAPSDFLDDLDDPSTEEGKMHERLARFMERVFSKRSDIDILYFLPPQIAFRFIDRILSDKRLTAEEVRRIASELRRQEISLAGSYIGEANIDPDERLTQMSIGDYVAFHHMPRDFTAYDELIAYFDNVWRFKSELRDVAIVRLMKAHEPTHRDVARLIPYMKTPERISIFAFNAYGQFLEENRDANLADTLRAIEMFFPKASRDRDALILDAARSFPIDLEAYRLISGYLGEAKRMEAEGLYVEHGLGLVVDRLGAAASDRAELMLWLLGISEEFPPNFVGATSSVKMDEDYLKRILQVTAERNSLFKMILIGSDGILLPHNLEARRMFLRRIWEKVFPSPSRLERLCFDVLDIVLSEITPYRQYKIVSALISMVYDKMRLGEDISMDELIPALLGAGGVEGVKLAQIFSSYGGLWEREPALARRLSDFQDESDLMHHYYLFEHLLREKGEDGVRHLRIHVPRRAGSIKGFFVGEDVRSGDTFGLLFLRPQASKNLMENRRSLEGILGRIGPLIRATYGAEVPDGIPRVVFAMISREVKFEHERGMATMLGEDGRRDDDFAYPRLIPEWQTPVVIGMEYVHPHASMKRLLALEGDAGEWEKMTSEEKNISRIIAGIGSGEPFDHGKFASAMLMLKFTIIEKLVTAHKDRRAIHLDPHPGNILISVEEGRPVVFMTDLGAEVEMSAEDESFIRDATAGLIEDDEEKLTGAVLRRFGNRPIDSKRVMGAHPKFRSIVLREELKKNGAKIPEAIEEYMFSLVKIDRLIPHINLTE